ncbi:MAG TPA: phosphoribosylamine--glycine ligase [Myxococcales bacterium]|nr:phosphoribosylamine--glycine ligase [Myxococcales bacterium]
MARVVVIGSGAREHALVRALRRSAEVVAVPGNPGIAQEARCVPAQPDLGSAALAEHPDLVVVGPEAPLAEGLADRIQRAGVPVFGPTQAAAQIEASKAFAKDVMRAAAVPTPEAAVFDDREKAARHARAIGRCVVKLDGLAAGKGVIVADDAAQAAAAVDELWKPGATLLIEERLTGPELSVIALCDGENLVPLPPARDHKRLREGDQGPNTGGMGAICSPPDATPELVEQVILSILKPTAAEMARRGTPFVGALYAGLMLTPNGPRVLEFNCRLGDPEAQAILLRLRSDAFQLFLAAAQGQLAGQKPSWDSRTAVAVVLAAHGYPGTPRALDEIRGIDAVEQGDDLWVLHAGTRMHDGKLVTGGGRVLTVAALGSGPSQARARAYGAAARIEFAGVQFRKDIALASHGPEGRQATEA